MGCDIHAYIEVKDESGQWQHYDWRKQYQVGTYEDGSPKLDYDKYWDDPLRIGRNYNLFAILADVRNGYGFAGVPTGQGFVPISNPRGLPEDVTNEVKRESNSWGVDGHSHSWLYLYEMITYPYDDLKTVHYGIVNMAQYLIFKEKGRPESWSGDVMGSSVVKVSNAGMNDLILGNIKLEEGKKAYTRVTWQTTYHDAVGEDWFNTLTEMRKLGDHDKVRLVFWFDN